MKKWIIFSVIFVGSLSLVISTLVLFTAQSPIRSAQKEAEQLALTSKSLAIVSNSYPYNGNKPYITVFGVDEYGKEKAVFVPITLEEKEIEQVFLEDGITKDQALAVLQDEVPVKEILHTKLGYERNNAVWEVTYLNDSDQLNYVYILFEDGQWWKRILNL